MAEQKTVKTNQPQKIEVTAKATANKGHKRPKLTVLVDTDDVADFGHGFVDFLREHAVVGLAVGFVIGTQVQGVVKQLVASFIDPLFTLLFGQALSKEAVTWHLTFTLHDHYYYRVAKVAWGAFLYSLLDLLFVLLVIYAIIKLLKLDKLDKKPQS